MKLTLSILQIGVMNILKSNFLTYLFGNIIFGFTQWFIIILILKLGTKTELGTYTYSIAIIAPLILFLSFGFNTLVVTTDNFKKSNYIKARWMVSFIVICIYMSVIVFFTGISRENYLLIFFIGLSKMAENLYDIDYAFFIKDKMHKYVGYYKLILSFTQIGLIIVCFYIYQNLVISFAIYSITLLLFNLIKNRHQLFVKEAFLISSFKLYKVGIPISITLFLSSLNTNIPKYFIEFHNNIVAVGIFSSFLTIYSAGNTFFFSLYNYVLPKAVKYKYDKKYLKSLFIKIIGIGILSFSFVQIINMTILENIIPLIFNEDFLTYKFEISIVLLSSVLVYVSILMDLFINGHNKYKYNTYVQVFNVFVVFLGSFILINKLEVLGAVLTFSIFSISVFLLKTLLSVKIIKGASYEV